MTAAHIQNDKCLILTFVTEKAARAFCHHCVNKLRRAVHSNKGNRVMLVDDAAWIDSVAIEARVDRRVSSAHVDWYIG